MKPKIYQKTLLVLLALMAFFTSYAQRTTVRGRVLSQEDGKPLVGATILVKGTTDGTQSNENGFFELKALPNQVLEISYSGYATKTVGVSSNEIVVSLTLQNASLNEVVVVGYGTQKRAEFAGASTSVNKLATKSTPSSNVATALQGTVPGLLVRQQTGAPGSTPNIVFRGGTDFGGGGTPMYVLDGIVVPSLYGIDMNDVESIDVLKDAASAAIYGARAANGVVLVTTKKGKAGRSQVTYGIKQTSNYIRSIAANYLTAEEYIRMNRIGIRNRYITDSLGGGNFASDKSQLTGNWGWAFGSSFGSPIGLYTTQRVNNTNRGLISQPGWKLMIDPNPFFPSLMDSILYKENSAIDREAMVMKRTTTTEHNIQFSGGNETGNFALGVGAVKDNGTFLNSWLKRLSLNFNGGLTVGKRFKVGLNTSAYDVQIGVPYSEPGIAGVTGATGGLVQRFLGVAPTVRYSNDTSGTILPGPNDITLGNPLYWKNIYVNSTNEQRFSGGINLEYDLGYGFKFLSNLGGFMRFGNNNYFTKAFQAGNGGAINTNRPSSFSNYRDFQYTVNGLLQFQRKFGNHNVTLMGGPEYFQFKRYVFSGSAQGAPTDIIPWVSASTPTSVLNGNLFNPASAYSNFSGWERIASLIGRVNYSFGQRYFLTGIIRYDGSSRLSPHNFYNLYPGVALGWNMHNEGFYKNNGLDKVFSTFKPRFSYGENGNLQYFGSDYFPTEQVYSNAGIYDGQGGLYAPSYINPDLTWESTNSTNLGADIGLWHNRITVVADYFVRNVFDKLWSIPISAQTGFPTYTANLAQLQNRGFEFALNARILQGGPKAVRLEVGGSFYTVKQFTKSLPKNGLPGNRIGGFEVWDPANPGKTKFVGGLIEGQRVGYDEVWAPSWSGIYTTQDMINKDAGVYIAFSPLTNKNFRMLGDAQWKQVYKNDTIDTRQFVFVGRTTPKGSGNFYVNTGWRGLQLYTAFDYAYGFVILDNDKLRGLSQVQGSQNGTKDILNTWTPANPTATLPQYSWANQSRNYATDASGSNPPANLWEKGDYVMLREVTLSYDLTSGIIGNVFKNKIKGLSLNITGSNLVYLTKYGGTFPEVGGYDNGRYPLPKRLTFGAKITL